MYRLSPGAIYLKPEAAYAATAWISDRMQSGDLDLERKVRLSEEERPWIDHRFAKIVLYIEIETELLELHRTALEAGFTAYLIQDSGDTEFGGEPTHTALGLGPHRASKLTPIIGHLPLL